MLLAGMLLAGMLLAGHSCAIKCTGDDAHSYLADNTTALVRMTFMHSARVNLATTSCDFLVVNGTLCAQVSDCYISKLQKRIELSNGRTRKLAFNEQLSREVRRNSGNAPTCVSIFKFSFTLCQV